MIQNIPVFLLLFALALSGLQAEKRPNILLIVADDHGYGDLGLTGADPSVRTPNLDRLAASGMRLTQAYATSPICSPSRVGIATGHHQARFDMWWYGGGGLAIRPDIPTLAEQLQSEGYATAMVGKIHSWLPDMQSRNYPMRHGFEHFFGFNGGGKHYLIHNAAAEAAFTEKLKAHAPELVDGYRIVFNQPWYLDDGLHDEDGFSTELLGRAARAFIEKEKDRPWFVQLAFNAVHDQTYQLPPDYLEAKGMDAHPDWDPATESADAYIQRTLVPNSEMARAWYLGQLELMDQEIGRILDFLEGSGEAKETLVIYTSDNGGSLANAANNHPLEGGKFTLFEGGIRVPFIIRWPGKIEGGKTNAAPISHLDLAPTLLSAAGIEDLPGFDGTNLLPHLLEGRPNQLEGQASPLEGRPGAKRTLHWDIGHSWAVREGDWKLRVVTRETKPSPYPDRPYNLPGIYLHNLATDPDESTNRIEEEPAIAARLSAAHRNWRDAMRDDFSANALAE